eukprot:PhM_4_TR8297/c0_g1_i1/m.40679
MIHDARRQQASEAVRRATDPTADAARREVAIRDVARLISLPTTCDLAYDSILVRASTDDPEKLHVLQYCLGLLQQCLCVRAPSVDLLFKIKMTTDALKCNTTVRMYGSLRTALDAVTARVEIKSHQLSSKDRLRWAGWLTRNSLADPIVTVPTPGDSTVLIADTAARLERNGSSGGNSMVGVPFVGCHLSGCKDPPVDTRTQAMNKSVVAVVARHKNKNDYGHEAEPPRVLPAVQFKYYVAQQPARTTSAEFSEILSSLHNMLDYTSNPENIARATQGLIKIICDMYARRLKLVSLLQEASCVFRSLLLEMISSTYLCVRRQAFDVLFNVAVHINILEELSSSVIAVVHNDLEEICMHMMLMLCLTREEDDSLWIIAYKCWLAIAHDPSCLDLRVLKQLISSTRHDFKLQQYTISLFLKTLTASSMSSSLSSSHNGSNSTTATTHAAGGSAAMTDGPTNTGGNSSVVDRLAAVGGVPYLVHLYTTTMSFSVRDKIFGLLFRISVQRQMQHERSGIVPSMGGYADATVVTKVQQFFRTSGAPWYLPGIFIFLPSNCVNELLLLTGLRRELAQCRHVVFGVVKEIASIARDVLKMNRDMEAEFRSANGSIAKLKATLLQMERLCQSESDGVRQEAEKFVFCCIKYIMEAGSPDLVLVPDEGSANSKFEDVLLEGRLNLLAYVALLQRFMHQLATSTSPTVRKMFLRLTHRMVLFIRSCQGQEPEEAPHVWFRMNRVISVNLAYYLKHNKQESDPDVLLYMLDIVLSSTGFLDMKHDISSTANTAWNDTIVDLFLQGVYKVQSAMLESLKFNVLMYLFNTLGLVFRKIVSKPNSPLDATRSIQAARLTALLLVQAHPDSLRVDPAVWKSLMADMHPPIATTAAVLYLHHTRTEDKARFSQSLAEVLSEAQQSGQTAALDNPYVQALAIARKYAAANGADSLEASMKSIA